LWNTFKGGVDEISTALANVRAPFAGQHPQLVMWKKILMMLLYNAHQTYRLLKVAPTVDSHTSVDSLLTKISSMGSFNDFLKSLSCTFTLPGVALPPPIEPQKVTGEGANINMPDNWLSYQPSQATRLAFFNPGGDPFGKVKLEDTIKGNHSHPRFIFNVSNLQSSI
jgi:hypothetical protein